MQKILDWFRSQTAEQRKRLYVAVGIVALLAGYWYSNQTAPEPEQAIEPVLTFESKYQVHVTGSVSNPGLYILDAGDRVKDAIDAAGGFADGALESSVNLARLLSDGEQILVLDQSQVGGADSRYISLNSANSSALEALPGIGPSTAKKIIDYRNQIGSFSAIEQLLEVPGIGPKLFDQIRDQITL